MSKKVINQKTNYNFELLNSIDSNFVFSEKPINRLRNDYSSNKIEVVKKSQALDQLKDELNSIEDCSLKNNGHNIVLGSGNIHSPIMLIGGAPGIEESKLEKPFMGEAGDLLKKMLIAINIKKENIYSTYVVNFRPPEDRKPTTVEIKKYSLYLQKHISIIKPKIIILMGSTSMEALTGINSKISMERGKWKEIIIKNITYNVIVTFNPSYLLRTPENKKYSWEDLKKIKQKIKDLNLIV
jgi:uracil-DNA glycosylase